MEKTSWYNYKLISCKFGMTIGTGELYSVTVFLYVHQFEWPWPSIGEDKNFAAYSLENLSIDLN